MLTPLGHVLTPQIGMQTKEGRCFTFHKWANGTVFSEGCGVVLLKPFEQAKRDRDPILGVIKGSGLNQVWENKWDYRSQRLVSRKVA